MEEGKKPYTPPRIESEEVLEQAALTCDITPFLTGMDLQNLKETSTACGFNDS